MPKPLTVWIKQAVENSERDGITRPPYLPLEKSVCRSTSKSYNQTRTNGPVQNWKEYFKAVYCHPAEYIMQNAGLDEAKARIKKAWRNINNLKYPDNITLMAKSIEELKSFLMKVKKKKLAWNSTFRNYDHGMWFFYFMANRWGSDGNCDRLYFLGLQNHWRWWLKPKN